MFVEVEIHYNEVHYIKGLLYNELSRSVALGLSSLTNTFNSSLVFK